MKGRLAPFALAVSLSACWLIPGSTPPNGSGAVTPKSGDPNRGNGASSEATAVAPDREVFAPPEGLPDLRPLFGLDPNHWTLGFLPGVTRQTAMADVLAAMGDMDIVERDLDGEFPRVKVIAKDPATYPGLSWAEVGFHRDEDQGGEAKAYDVTVHFKRRYRFEPAMRQYVLHLTRFNFGAIEDPSKDIITIMGPDYTSVQVTKDIHGGVELKVSLAKAPLSGRRAPSLTKPDYAAVQTFDAADYAPPEGMPDGREVIGLDPDHWAPAFLPLLPEGTSEKDAIAAVEEAGFALRGRPRPGDSAFIKFVPKTKDAAPGVKLLTLYVVEDEKWEGRGLRNIELEMMPGLNRKQAYVDHLVALAQLNFADAEPEEVDEIMTFSTDGFTQFQLSNQRSGLSLRFDAPPFRF